MKALAQWAKPLLRFLGPIALLIACMVLAEILKRPITAFDSLMDSRQAAFQRALIGVIVIGSVMLVIAFICLLIRGQSMTPEQVQEHLDSLYQGKMALSTGRKAVYRFRGKTAGRAFEIEVSFRQIKELVRTGLWLRAAVWRSFFAAAIGVSLICISAAGLLIVHAPPWLQVMTIVIAIYVLARTAMGFCRA